MRSPACSIDPIQTCLSPQKTYLSLAPTAEAASGRGRRRLSSRLAGAVRAGLAASLLLAGSACSVRALQGGALELPEAAETSLTASALYRAQSFYLYPEKLDRRMIVGALNALEERFDPIRFQEDDPERGLPATAGTLWVGQERVRVPLRGELVPDEFAELLGRVVRFVEEHLPKEPGELEQEREEEEDDIELIALQGALQELDRYSTVFAGRNTEDFEIRFSGKLYGIGTRISREEGVLKATEVFEDGPAARAGLIDGDAIDSIDGDPTRALSVRDAVDRIRGEAGTQVLLAITRVDPKLETEQQLTIPITRGEVQVPSVRTRDLEDRIGYARIDSVARTTHEEFREKVYALGQLDGLVLDLRGNTGGSMLAAAALADYFVDSDTILRVVDRSGSKSSSPARAAIATSRVLFRFPVVVLVDGSTASAAEIFSGAIAPLERVTLMGQRTFGKGLIQRVLPLPREHMLKLTVGEYLLSGDRAIHEKGLDPDVELYPVSPENLGALADRPERALAYLRDPKAKDDRPIEIAKSVLLKGQSAALEELRLASDQEIAKKLEALGIRWAAPEAITSEQLGLPLRIEGGPVRVLDGTPTRVAVKVSNPNEIAIPHAWAALNGPVDFLRNKLIPLGTIPPGGSAWGEVEIEPADGLASSPLPLTVYVTSGRHQLQSERVEVPIENHSPDLEIDVVRIGEDQLEVGLRNRGCCSAGTILVSVPGTVRPIEDLAAGDTRKVELPLSGDVETVAISLAGAGVSRRIDIPVPVDRVRVIPPQLRLAKTTFLGKSQVRVDAISNEGLREGWLALDGEKEIYVAWDGASDGTLRADLARLERISTPPRRDFSVRTKVETLSGISLIDVRTLTKD